MMRHVLFPGVIFGLLSSAAAQGSGHQTSPPQPEPATHPRPGESSGQQPPALSPKGIKDLLARRKALKRQEAGYRYWTAALQQMLAQRMNKRGLVVDVAHALEYGPVGRNPSLKRGPFADILRHESHAGDLAAKASLIEKQILIDAEKRRRRAAKETELETGDQLDLEQHP